MNIAVIFAGGVGSRMHSKTKPKQFLELHNKPILIHTLEKFEESSEIDSIIVSCKKEWIDYTQELVEKYNINKVERIVQGGESGQLSIYSGLCAAKEIALSDDDIVLIHDGVRPFINNQVIRNNIDSVLTYGTAITTGEVKETILVVDDDGEIKLVPDRNKSRVAKAPQSFLLKDILNAHRMALDSGKTDFIDSCTMMKYYGYSLHLVDGPSQNIKITTPEDFYTMRALLDAKENAQIYGYEE